MDEFALIRRHFQNLTTLDSGVALGIGDDCALLRGRPGYELAVTTDTLVAGRHFPTETAPQDLGWKALAVNLSDLAAMGAEPQAFLLALTLPHADSSWLEAFADGLGRLAQDAGIALVGGDTTRGPLSITITAIGRVPEARALRRGGALPGDAICVTGTLGDAALGLALLRQAAGMTDRWTAAHRWLRERLDRPQPRLSAGRHLLAFAHAAIDLSDGFAGDLRHILDASGGGAEIEIDRLPMSPAFAALHEPADRLRLQAAGGDDYELCVCLPPDKLAQAQAALTIPLTQVGRITAQSGLRWFDHTGREVDGDLQAYDHFRV